MTTAGDGGGPSAGRTGGQAPGDPRRRADRVRAGRLHPGEHRRDLRRGRRLHPHALQPLRRQGRAVPRVIQESATQAADAQIAIIDRYLSKVTDLEADLVEFGIALAADAGTAEHFALVRQINAEAGHIPQDAIDAWQETGPLRVRRGLARRLGQLADGDCCASTTRACGPALHAAHLGTNPSYRGADRPDEGEVTRS